MTPDSDTSGTPVPKLSIGQRLLTALPSLQRQPAPLSTRRPDDEADENTDGDTDGSAAQTTADTATSAPGGRLRDGLVKSPTAGTRTRAAEELDSMSREEIAHRIKRLDDRERFLALTAAPIGVAVGVLLTVITIHIQPAHYINGKLNPKYVSESIIVLEGGARILLSGLVVAAALSRRRSLVGFSLLFLGTAMGSPLFALPFWALGGYLIWRVFKYQRALTAKGGAPGRTRATGSARAGGRVPASPRAAGRAGAAAARDRTASPRRRARKEPASSGPTPSKRYTPPRPVRPRPPAPPS